MAIALQWIFVIYLHFASRAKKSEENFNFEDYLFLGKIFD